MSLVLPHCSQAALRSQLGNVYHTLSHVLVEHFLCLRDFLVLLRDECVVLLLLLENFKHGAWVLADVVEVNIELLGKLQFAIKTDEIRINTSANTSPKEEVHTYEE